MEPTDPKEDQGWMNQVENDIKTRKAQQWKDKGQTKCKKNSR